ncbi:2-oxoacid:acceptor oxidoreductase family protein [Desulforhopalus singaporensis]|uniref:2-oxoglutarate ferredoxin oxidoreductase subunit gamma n=1 Tax=Desulforhopalus singaporensis TaxID=91360 RepID=A0A1H0N9C7_9BACT|nr:2-oxoacid:acceptor oxidoreductase family protein [Desulforhopalus singaporensis]SDO88890.1 2-oxoglutarate ferredoxin oxidoreductase subunit gamma [Desulforhopalus singaporensis]
MKKKLVFAGSGGQGVISMATLTCLAAIECKWNAVMSQTYGIEQRGGTAVGFVVISDEEIGSPMIEEDADICCLMHPMIVDAHIKDAASGGIVLYNSSLVKSEPVRESVEFLSVPATDAAQELGERRAANMFALGRLSAETGFVPIEALCSALEKMLGEKKKHLVEINQKALRAGYAGGCNEEK